MANFGKFDMEFHTQAFHTATYSPRISRYCRESTRDTHTHTQVAVTTYVRTGAYRTQSYPNMECVAQQALVFSECSST